MAMREIPVQYEHKCDGCGVCVTGASKSRPKYWTGLDISADAYDYSGNACADASTKRLLCQDCTGIVHKAVNSAIEARRAAMRDSDTHPKGGDAGGSVHE